LVKNIHGKGNFITKFHDNKNMTGLEKLGNPIYKCLSGKIDDVEMQFRIELITDYAKQVLNRNMTAVVAIERWYKRNDQAVAFAFTVMAIEAVSELHLDLQDEQQLLDMIDKRVYELANSATIELKRSDSIPSLKYEIANDKDCDLIVESVYISDKYPVIYNKFYIPTGSSKITINAAR
jgi:GntR family transcriptional regulator